MRFSLWVPLNAPLKQKSHNRTENKIRQGHKTSQRRCSLRPQADFLCIFGFSNLFKQSTPTKAVTLQTPRTSQCRKKLSSPWLPCLTQWSTCWIGCTVWYCGRVHSIFISPGPAEWWGHSCPPPGSRRSWSPPGCGRGLEIWHVWRGCLPTATLSSRWIIAWSQRRGRQSSIQLKALDV